MYQYLSNSPHLCVGFLFLVVHFRLRLPPPSASFRPPPANLSPHNLLTHNLFTHNLSTHNLSTHNLLTHTTCHHLLTHNLSPHGCWRGRRGTWRHGSVTLRGRRGTYGTGLALVARLGPSWRRGRCGSLRGRRGTWWHGLALCVAGVALMRWLWWHGCWTCFDMSAEAAIDFDCRAGNLHVLFWRCAQVWKMFSSGTSVLSASAVHTHTHAHIHMHT